MTDRPRASTKPPPDAPISAPQASKRAHGTFSGRPGPIQHAVALAHLTHGFPTALVVVLAACMLVVAHGGVPPVRTLVPALMVVALSQFCVGTLNDFLDREQDARLQPEKPIPSGSISPTEALAIAVVSGTLLPLVAITLGAAPAAVAVFGLFGGVAYDLWLKPTQFGLLGYLVGFESLIAFVWLVAGTMNAWFALVVPAGCALLLAAHLANAYPDIEVDQQHGNQTLAARLGPVRTRAWAAASVLGVNLGGIVLSVATAHAVLAPLFVLGALAVLAAFRFSGRSDVIRQERLRFFRVLGLACGFTALAGVALIRALS